MMSLPSAAVPRPRHWRWSHSTELNCRTPQWGRLPAEPSHRLTSLAQLSQQQWAAYSYKSLKVKEVHTCSCSCGNPTTELRDVTCSNGSQYYTCHPTTPARPAGTQFTYPGRMEGWVDLNGWLLYIPKWFTCRQTVTSLYKNLAASSPQQSWRDLHSLAMYAMQETHVINTGRVIQWLRGRQIDHPDGSRSHKFTRKDNKPRMNSEEDSYQLSHVYDGFTLTRAVEVAFKT